MALQKDAGVLVVQAKQAPESELNNTGGESVVLSLGLYQVVDCEGLAGCCVQEIWSIGAGLQHGEDLKGGLLGSRRIGVGLREKMTGVPF